MVDHTLTERWLCERVPAVKCRYMGVWTTTLPTGMHLFTLAYRLPQFIILFAISPQPAALVVATELLQLLDVSLIHNRLHVHTPCRKLQTTA